MLGVWAAGAEEMDREGTVLGLSLDKCPSHEHDARSPDWYLVRGQWCRELDTSSIKPGFKCQQDGVQVRPKGRIIVKVAKSQDMESKLNKPLADAGGPW